MLANLCVSYIMTSQNEEVSGSRLQFWYHVISRLSSWFTDKLRKCIFISSYKITIKLNIGINLASVCPLRATKIVYKRSLGYQLITHTLMRKAKESFTHKRKMWETLENIFGRNVFR